MNSPIEVIPATPLVFSHEDLRMIFPEVMPLWHAHWYETEGYRSGSEPFAPDFDQYERLEAAGMWRQFCARDEADGRLAGHIGYIVHKSRHTQRMNAVEDYFFMVNEYRRGFNALGLLRFAIAELRKEGVKQIGMSSKLTHDISVLLKRAGFKHVAQFWVLIED